MVMAQQPGTGHRVLLVEDDDGDAFLVRELLAEVDPAVALTVVDSVDGAVRAGDLDQYDCVLLDMNLPGTTGLDGLRAILRDDSGAAVCVLTGLDDEHLGTAAVAAGDPDAGKQPDPADLQLPPGFEKFLGR